MLGQGGEQGVLNRVCEWEGAYHQTRCLQLCLTKGMEKDAPDVAPLMPSLLSFEFRVRHKKGVS